jgi:lysophospholipase L1-like esterase
VSDPASIVVLDTGERARTVRWKRDPLPPVRFRDANGDGVFRLACLGDSNTQAPLEPKWCEKLRDLVADPRFEVVNVAIAGATVVEDARVPSRASEQLQEVLPLEPDALVLSFGTNDRLLGNAPTAIRDAYAVIAAAADAAGMVAYVATTPPTRPCVDAGCPQIAAANLVLWEAFGAHVIDFFDGVVRAHLVDAFHLGDAAQDLRAERAFAVIENPLARSGTSP